MSDDQETRCPARDGGEWDVHPTTDDCRDFMEETE